jgi:polar amino acid transport system substrate-binding protein
MFQKYTIMLKAALFLAAGSVVSSPTTGSADTQTCSSVTLNGSSTWFPISLRKEEGANLSGVFPDLARQVFHQMNVATEFGTSVPWKRAFALLDNGQINVLTGAYRTRDRLDKFGASLPVMEEEVAVFVRSNLEIKPKNLDDLVGLSGLAPFGANFGEEFDEFAAGNLTIERQPFEAFATNMRLLQEEKVDYLIIARQEGERLFGKLKAGDRVEALPWSAAVNTVHFFFSKSSPCIHLLEEFNDVLSSQIRSGALDNLIRDYQSEGSATQ